MIPSLMHEKQRVPSLFPTSSIDYQTPVHWGSITRYIKIEGQLVLLHHQVRS